MITAPEVMFSDDSLDYPLLKLADPHGTPVEQSVQVVAPLRKFNFVVNEDYTKRLLILGFSIDDFDSSRSGSLGGGATIPVNESTWPLNGHEE